MIITRLILIIIILVVVTLLAAVIGGYMARVFDGRRTLLSPLLSPLEHLLYRICGIEGGREMSWKSYAKALLVFNILGFLALFSLQELQGRLFFNPQSLGAVRWDTAANAAISFVTNTNWQSYSGEQTMSYLTQMMGMTVQNFLSAGVGLAASIALIRGIVRRDSASIGNFWVDLTRSVLYVLLPLALIWALLLASQGVVQTLGPYVSAETLEGREQIIAVGPAASQIAIKQLGSNGGGFFNANSAHPLENPTPFSNFLEMLAILLLPASLPFAFGSMLNDRRLGWALYAAMLVLFLLGLAASEWAELSGSPLLTQLGIENGTNMEGKEMRFSLFEAVLWAVSTTATSNGSVDAMHDSMMPLAGLVLLFNMIVGEVIFGGIGVGLMGIIFYAVLTMFIAGLMIGRSPELLGKKLEPFEMKMATIALLLPSVAILAFAGVAISLPIGLSSLNNAGPHGLSEILYAFASACGNNGSAFAGLNANTVFYNLALAAGMLIGRFATIIPALAIAGSLAQKKAVPPSSGTFPFASILFVIMLIGVIIIVGALTFFPALVLGPALEHWMVQAGRTF
jgi:K+-transporting ATPase ATPase A chain